MTKTTIDHYLTATQRKAKAIILHYGEVDAYEIATDILHILSKRGFCAWQTYTKDDVAVMTGVLPSNEYMAELCDNMQNGFEQVAPED